MLTQSGRLRVARRACFPLQHRTSLVIDLPSGGDDNWRPSLPCTHTRCLVTPLLRSICILLFICSMKVAAADGADV